MSVDSSAALNKALTLAQRTALDDLNAALSKATASGLFDTTSAWDAITPNIINAFCDGVTEMSPTPRVSAESLNEQIEL